MPKTVLIVEDEIFVALDLERILTDAGYRVAAIAADSHGALAAAADCHFALVDVNLRDGPTGPGLATKLARDYGVKVVFVTANPGQIGQAESATPRFSVGRTVLWTTIVSAVMFGLFYLKYVEGWITADVFDLTRFRRR